VQKLALGALTLAAMWLPACGADRPTGVGEGTTTTAAARPAVTDPPQLLEANALVLEADDGPMLCLGPMRLPLLPPRCGDLPLTSWDWDAVEGAESADGRTWGTYHVVGTFEGGAFTVTDVGPFEDEPFEDVDFSSPCPEPPGGWPIVDAERTTQEYARAASAYASSQPDYVTSWSTHLYPEQEELGPVVFNAVFTGDVSRHEAELRKVWVGPLCVVRRGGPTADELRRIRREVEVGHAERGLRMLWSQITAVEPTVEIGVVADADGRLQAQVDEEYGPGVVRIVPALRPVE
jgi:hypothetical protein